MLKVIGFLLLLHSAISLIRYRKHLIYNDTTDQYHIPLDILLEIIVGFALNMFFGVIMDKKFANIHEFPHKKTYDQAFQRPNFRQPGGRGGVLQSVVKDKIGNFDINH
ncbi:unnamed protein product (macronuclear) [Paramecium tetraurelia]|uniref:Uncharacterized protein n=1 Tax=Paramecium tetraurelia TaxID=5888 RepID=A0CKB5_PARTE|nr:uncharacterized protein GSPATT00000945001 [Paramecium tetraurelia]CAK71232.1 unnamed protein product [Paramecium tetraurelia]|eukprot:XP_001438629.1 hypothetical protein (macronuclear) [Paramecium tetraurelia strain d4-2]